ncbi:MAG: hypothetical protein ACJ8IK_21125, partial [Burkholderiaceae bacterium]
RPDGAHAAADPRAGAHRFADLLEVARALGVRSLSSRAQSQDPRSPRRRSVRRSIQGRHRGRGGSCDFAQDDTVLMGRSAPAEPVNAGWICRPDDAHAAADPRAGAHRFADLLEAARALGV